jgi:hypothetical protein
VLGALVAQLLVHWAGWAKHLTRLFYLSWAMTTCGCLLFLFSWRLLRQHQGARPAWSLHAGAAAIAPEDWEDEDGQDDAWAGDGPGTGESQRASDAQSRAAAAWPLGRAWAHLKWMGRTAWRSYADAEIRAWSCWWVGAFAANFIFGNYYQTLLVHFYKDAPYGLLEMLLELGALLGAASASWPWLQRRAATHPSAVMALCSLLSAACCGLATLDWPSPAMLFLLVVGEGLGMASLFALASAAIAKRLRHRYYAVTFGANMLLALGLSTAAIGVTSAVAGTTVTFMWLCAGLFVCAPLAAWLSRCAATEIESDFCAGPLREEEAEEKAHARMASACLD